MAAPPRLSAALQRATPPWSRRVLSTDIGRRFVRFIPVAAAAAVTSLTADAVFLAAVHLTAGVAGVLAAMLGALVSYLLSRWVWERRGHPDVLRETLPFWLVSVSAWIVLGAANKLGVALAASLHLAGAPRVAVAEGVYLTANALTVVARFLIFHYVLFAGGRSSSGRRSSSPGSPQPSPAAAAAPAATGADPGDRGPSDGQAAAAGPDRLSARATGGRRDARRSRHQVRTMTVAKCPP